MNKQLARGLEIVGGIIVVIALIIWYTTPDDVIAGPIVLALIGIAVSATGWLMGRSLDKAATDDLAARLRAEREQAGDGQGGT